LVFSIWFVVLIFSQDPGKDPAQTRRVIGDSGKEGKFFFEKIVWGIRLPIFSE
jgi:hypothetical protein